MVMMEQYPPSFRSTIKMTNLFDMVVLMPKKIVFLIVIIVIKKKGEILFPLYESQLPNI